MRKIVIGSLFLILVVVILSACGGKIGENNAPLPVAEINAQLITNTPFQPNLPSGTATPIPEPVYLTGAGDISVCGQDSDDLSASIMIDVPGYIFALGDTQYGEASYDQFMDCFDPSWGKYKDRILPVVGNHEYADKNAAGFYKYFKKQLDSKKEGYYSLDIGTWHIIVLNSMCDEIGGCKRGSKMVTWLENDLNQNDQLCTLALWHHPRFSTGYHGSDESMDTLWQIVVEHDVDLVLNGHEHNYERFAPMDAAGNINLSDGTRQIIVGTGGASLRPQYYENSASMVYNASQYGVLQLMLDYGTYTWEFIPVEENGFSDAGRGYCH